MADHDLNDEVDAVSDDLSKEESTDVSDEDSHTELNQVGMLQGEEPAEPADDASERTAGAGERSQREMHWMGRWLAPGLALLIGITALLSIFLQDCNRDRQVDPADWQAGAEEIRAGYRNGDVIRVEPLWSDDPRVFLDGATFDLTPEPQRDILDKYDRVWVLAGFNRGKQVAAAMPEAYELKEEASFGQVDLLLYDIPASAKPRLDFQNVLATAEVRRIPANGRAEVCSLWRDDAWYCGRIDRFLYVGRRMRDMDDEPRYCIYTPALPNNTWHEVTFPDIQLGDTIRGKVGMDNWAVRSERGSATEFQVLVGSQVLHQQELQPRDPEFHPFQIDTTKLESQERDVTFRVRAADFFDRFLCFTAQIPGE